jgi:hypothetical protein
MSNLKLLLPLRNMVPLLPKVAQAPAYALLDRIESIEARQAALETRLAALEGAKQVH